jgi:alpha-L-fucosidase
MPDTFRPNLFAALAAIALTPSLLFAVDPPAATAKAAENNHETKAQRDARMQWWREARFGMFIHWGLYSVPAGTYHGRRIGGIGEWIMNDAEIPVAEYAGYAKKFNPVKFNADEWVSIAKNAGMKYIVITSKHHDGFAMFHSKTSAYNIVDATPFARDPLKELAAACKKQGIKLGFYYSQAQDWHHPGGFAYSTHGRPQGHWDKAQDGDFHKYIHEIAIPQVREILTNYGDVAVLWWDTPAGMNRAEVQELAGLLKLQPHIIANNRLGNGVQGDTETPEQFIPATGYPGDWETCMTINDTWGYKFYDRNWKPTETLLRNLIDIASKGGNYLLNVGPTSEGVIPPACAERLSHVGEWLKVNGESIYGTSRGPFKRGLPWGRATQKSETTAIQMLRATGATQTRLVQYETLYLHVFDWPTDGKLLVPLLNRPLKAYLLVAKDKGLEFSAGEHGITIELPAEAPDKIASVVVLVLDRKPEPFGYHVRPAADGTVSLKAVDADIDGVAQVENRGGAPNIGFWTEQKTTVSWNIDVPAGEYSVALEYAAEPSSDGNELQLVAGGEALSATIHATGSWETYKTVQLGKLKVPEGVKRITVKPTKLNGPVMNLRWIKLSKAQ